MSEEQSDQQPSEADRDSTTEQSDPTNENEESTSPSNGEYPADREGTADQEQPADTAGSSDHEQQDEDSESELDKWKVLARKHERESSKLREQVSAHENAVTEAHHALASERLHTKLARAGMPEEDAAALIEHIDPQRLVEDGTPSAKAIESVAASLSRSLTRGVDQDQGQASETPSISADQWLRKKARK